MLGERERTKRWMAIVAVSTVIGLLLGVLGSFLVPRQYAAETTLYVQAEGASSPSEVTDMNAAVNQRLESYVGLLSTGAILAPALERAGVTDLTPSDLAGRLTTSVLPESVLITVQVRDGSPERAVALTQAVAESAQQILPAFEDWGTSNAHLVVKQVNEPGLSTTASNPNMLANAAVGALAGLLVGWVIVGATEALRSPRRRRVETATTPSS